ncbi:MAG: DMT family transporter [Fimbriimonadia bacterium]
MSQRKDLAADSALLAVLAIWVGSFLVFKVAFHQFQPHAFNLARFTLMIPLAFATLWFSEGDLRLRRSDLRPMIVSGLLGFGIYQSLFISGLARTQASNMALLLSMTPVFSALILALFRLETVTRGQWAGIAISMAGVALFITKGGSLGQARLGPGDLMALGSSACFAAYGILNKPLLERMTPVRLMAYGLLIGIVPLIPVSLPDVMRQDWAAIDTSGWLLLAYATVFPVYLAYMLWNWAIARHGVIRTAPVSYLVPVFTGLAAWLFLGERLTAVQVLAGAVVLAGVGLTRSSPSSLAPVEE